MRVAVENVFNFYVSDSFQDVGNCLYPHHHEVRSLEDFIEVAKFDHTCIKFKSDYRNKDNFQESDTNEQDVDNDHSEISAEWYAKEDLHRIFDGIPHIIVESRHHMQWKGKYSPRPRYHIIFLSLKKTNAEEYTAFNQRLLEMFPFFDDNSIDAGRFFFAVKNVVADFYPGTI